MSNPEILYPATTHIMLSTDTYTLAAIAGALFVLACAFYPSSLLRWFQRKRYQYEVTFSLYMLTPTEKFVFSTCSPPLLTTSALLHPTCPTYHVVFRRMWVGRERHIQE